MPVLIEQIRGKFFILIYWEEVVNRNEKIIKNMEDFVEICIIICSSVFNQVT